MIEKIKFVSITGPKADMDRMIENYLSDYDIHLENALSELKTVQGLKPYIEQNPYKQVLQRSLELLKLIKDTTYQKNTNETDLTLEEAIQTVQTLDKTVSELVDKKENLLQKKSTLQTSLDKILPFCGLDYDICAILHFKYIKFRFGRISHEYFDKFTEYVYDTIDTVFYKSQEDDKYVWGVYFVPDSISEKIDAIYASMHFERFFLPDEYKGTPMEAATTLKEKIKLLQIEIEHIEEDIQATFEKVKDSYLSAHQKLIVYSNNFDIRKMAACTKQDINTFYIICGWMSQKDAKKFQNEISKDDNVFCIVEDDHNNISSKPPTKLKNPWLFKPFELFIEMYGLPAYNELDPTFLIALSYSILFGFMFGDVGQGLSLLVGGFLLYRFKKLNLAAIISCCGFFSTIFGFLFGSIFGFETIIEPLWLHPKSAMTKLPFIGNLNTVFVAAIAIGMGIILLAIILNIINGLRNHDPEKAFFDTNGIAGLVFYASLVIVIILFMTGQTLPASSILTVMFIIPLLVIFFKEPLTAIIEKKAEKMPTEKGMFVVQGFFELFEVLLSYFSNTLSFVRVGAFAISHAAMMEVVLMLAGAEAGASPNWLVIILGNIFVCGMEGLIVGIQVLRLEYYELFSRFYQGTGRAFVPYDHNSITK